MDPNSLPVARRSWPSRYIREFRSKVDRTSCCYECYFGASLFYFCKSGTWSSARGEEILQLLPFRILTRLGFSYVAYAVGICTAGWSCWWRTCRNWKRNLIWTLWKITLTISLLCTEIYRFSVFLWIFIIQLMWKNLSLKYNIPTVLNH